jgi:hypothetical protein
MTVQGMFDPSPKGSVPDMHKRLESSDVGRALISGFLLVTLVVILALNLPDSELTRRLRPLANSYRTITGIEQGWGVFAPNPRNRILEWYARVEFSDGSVDVWRAPDDPFSVHRWASLMEFFLVESFRGWSPESLAPYVARQVATEGREPSRVTFVRRVYPLRPPGWRGAPAAWQERAYYARPLISPHTKDHRL